MLTSIRTFAAFLAVAVLASSASLDARAQAASPEVIDLEEALELAVERNLRLRQSANEVALGETSVGLERAAFYPSLSVSAGPSMRLGRAFDPSTASLTDQRSESLNLSASSSINLFNGFADVASLNEARRHLEASENSFERARQSILYETTTQYHQIFLTEELIRVQEENLEAQRQQLASIEAAYEAGNRPIADVLQQRASIAQAEQRLIAAQRDYELSMLDLKQTLNLSPVDSVVFERPGEAVTTPRGADYDVGELVRQAMSQRDDLSAQRLRIDAAEQGVRAARAGYYPSISLNASTGTNYSSLNDQFGLTDQLSNVNPNGSIGLSISMPIFDRQQTSAAVERAQVSVNNERIALEQIEQDVAYQVQQSLLDYRTAQAQLRAAERQLESARQSLDAAEARYEVGASTLLEVTEARSLVVEAATGRLEALYNVLDSELAIAFSTGTLDEALAARLQ